MARKHSENSTETEAQRILDRVAEQSETVGTSSMRRAADRVRGHLNPGDLDQERWTEVWGTRIGRTLGLVFLVVLVVYLMRTYLFHV